MYTISINTDNAAFGDDPGAELARILRQLAAHLDAGDLDEHRNIMDLNGNTVGAAAYTPGPVDIDA